MNELMASLQGWGGNTDEDINFFWSCSKNQSWQQHEGHDGRLHGLSSKIGLEVHQNTDGKPTSRAFDWCNKNVVSSTVK